MISLATQLVDHVASEFVESAVLFLGSRIFRALHQPFETVDAAT